MSYNYIIYEKSDTMFWRKCEKFCLLIERSSCDVQFRILEIFMIINVMSQYMRLYAKKKVELFKKEKHNTL